jgi:hypothetical protein
MSETELALLRWVIETLAIQQTAMVTARLDAFANQLTKTEENFKMTFGDFTAKIDSVTAKLENVHTDVLAQKAEIQALKDQVANMGLDATQEAAIMAGLTTIDGKATTIDELTAPDPAA